MTLASKARQAGPLHPYECVHKSGIVFTTQVRLCGLIAQNAKTALPNTRSSDQVIMLRLKEAGAHSISGMNV